MKHKIIRICLLLIALVVLPNATEAKKIYYGDNIMYDGKVDGNGNPAGKGKLLLHYELKSSEIKKSSFSKLTGFDASFGGLKKFYHDIDIIEGEFNGNTISNATVRFNISKEDTKNCERTYIGNLEYAINNSSITYKLTNGILRTTNGEEYECRPETPCVFTRSIDLSFSRFSSIDPNAISQTYSSSGLLYLNSSNDKYASVMAPINKESIGHFKSYSGTYILGDERLPSIHWKNSTRCWAILPVNDESVILFDNGVKVVNGKNIEYPNGDYFRHDGTVLTAFSKKYENGMAKLLAKGAIEYTKNGEKSTVLYDENMPVDELFRTLMNVSDFPLATFSKMQVSPQDLSKKILSIICDTGTPISEAEPLVNVLLGMEKSDEQKKALNSIVRECLLKGTGMDGDLMLAVSHEGTQRGRQEIALASKIEERMIEEGICDTATLIEYAYRCRQNREITKAKKYFQKAADEGNVMAMRGLAFCYEDENNMKEAEVWYTKLLETDASEQYCVDAMNFFRKNNRSDKILQVLKLCAEKSNNRDAMLRLGDIYRNGHDWEFKKSGIEVTKNYATALNWYKKARETGSKAALFFMADCYWNGGPGVPQNRVQAGKLYNQLKEEAGLINMNISEAELLEKSRANYQFGYCLETGTGVVKNIPLAWAMYSESIEADAYYRKAVMLEKRWVEPTLRYDYRKQRCRVLYQLAANLGHKQAQQALNRIYR